MKLFCEEHISFIAETARGISRMVPTLGGKYVSPEPMAYIYALLPVELSHIGVQRDPKKEKVGGKKKQLYTRKRKEI